MLTLVYNITNISCDLLFYQKERLKTEVKSCVNQAGEKVDGTRIGNNIDYMLELMCCKRETVLNVLVMVKNIREEKLSITEESISLIRCTEHIGMNRYNYDYEIKFDKYRNFYYLKSEEFKIGTYSSEDPAMRGRIKTNLTAISMKHPLFVAESTEEYTEGWTQSKSISEFRKAVGIAGDAIRNTKLKFRVVLEVLNRRSDSFLTITVETKPFSFFENEDGTLALNKEIGLKRCLKNFIT